MPTTRSRTLKSRTELERDRELEALGLAYARTQRQRLREPREPRPRHARRLEGDHEGRPQQVSGVLGEGELLEPLGEEQHGERVGHRTRTVAFAP